MSLSALDFSIIAIPLCIVITIAVLMRRYTHSVADFLAANRSAGRYLITTASSELGAAVMVLVANMEVFSKTGFSMGFWTNFTSVFFLVLTLFGVVTYRFRETRCLTFHQFLGMRYSRGIRVFASFANIFSGLINFGLVPAVGARFFVYFCGLPEHISWFGFSVPTFAMIMVALMAISLVLTITGGQISVMVTDCVEGLFSGFFYLLVAFFILSVISVAQMKGAFLSGMPGASYVNPMDMGTRDDFNGVYVILSLVFSLSFFRGNAWNQGFSASAKSAHEGRMASILASWRGWGTGAMISLISIGAFTLLHHPDFAAQREEVFAGLRNIGSPQLQTQMAMPMALGVLLAPGVKGAFCAIALFGVLSSQGMQLHSYGSTLLQDVILPWRKRPLSPKAHLVALRLSALGVGIFVCVFSILYKPVDYLTMMVSLIGSIYLGGIGAVVWGGLYWKKGTTAGAWASMLMGTSLAVAFNLVQQFWPAIQPVLLKAAEEKSWANCLATHPEKCPINGMEFSVITAVCAFVSYIAISLLTCKKDYNMEEMLHRGPYALAEENSAPHSTAPRLRWGRFIGIDEYFTKGDKVLSVSTFCWSIFWQALAVVALVWWLAAGGLSDDWWFHYNMVTGIWIPLCLGIVTTIWFTIGTIHDIISLFKTFRRAHSDDMDDGSILKTVCVPPKR